MNGNKPFSVLLFSDIVWVVRDCHPTAEIRQEKRNRTGVLLLLASVVITKIMCKFFFIYLFVCYEDTIGSFMMCAYDWPMFSRVFLRYPNELSKLIDKRKLGTNTCMCIYCV